MSTARAPIAQAADEELPAPRRVLIVSADIGGGHHATGRALEQAVRARWPTARVTWVDTLSVMGAGRLFRGIYRANVEWTPWLYDFFYDQIDRRRWFARASKAVTSAWAGWRLGPVVRAEAPDLVLSTYPLGSGGLAWLRRRGLLDVPVGAWVSDFAPHPFWLYDELDLHVVMHERCLPLAQRAVPAAPVRAPGALPVAGSFRPGRRDDARAALGLRRDAFVVLISCGVYAFGAVHEAVEVLLAAGGPRIQVVVACGRNTAMHRRLSAHPESGRRLVALGWSDRMAELTRACDVVVTNAGGATALEALATARPVLMFRPIAGHGRANAEAMAAAGVAVVCRDGAELAAAVRRLLDDEAARQRLEHNASAAAGHGDLAADVELLVRQRRRPAAAAEVPAERQLSSSDEFFLLVDTPRVPQHVAAVALMRPDGDGAVPADLISRGLAATVPFRPWLTWRLRRPPGREPRWGTGRGGTPVAGTPLPVRDAAVPDGDVVEYFSRFVARPFPPEAPPWEVEMTPDWPDGRTAMLIRAHHAFGDGLAVLDAFTGITTDGPTPEPAPPRPVRSDGPGAAGRDRQLPGGLALGRLLARGLFSLARAGAAPPGPLHARRSGDLPARHAFTVLPLPRVRAAARAAGAGTGDFVVAVVAEALHRFLAERGTPSPSGTVRAMVPRTLRGAAAVDGPGNRTVALRVDLPVGPAPAADRVERVRTVSAAAMAQGQPLATAAVLRLVSRLPLPLRRRAARWLYRATWFDLIVSVLPGPRGARWFTTARVEEAYAVLPLAEGLGLAVGAMSWDGRLTVSVTYDPVLLPDGGRVAAHMRPALEALEPTA